MVGQLETAVPTGHRYAGDLDRAEEVAAAGRTSGSPSQGAGLLRGVYALRLGQIALWRGALARAEQHFLEAVMALEGDAMTRACAVDHVRYTRALTGRSDMPSALPPNAMYAVEHGFLSVGASRPRRATSPTPGRWPSAPPAGPSSTGHVSYAIFALYEAARHGAAPAAAELLGRAARRRGRLLPALVAAVGGAGRAATATGWRRSAAGSRSWAASSTPPS